MSVLTNLKATKAEIERLREEAKTKVESIFKTAVLELFTEYPNLKQISWTQYTPYFNDGDPCTFSSHHNYASIKFTSTVEGEDDEDGYDEKWSTYHYYDGYGKDKKLKSNLTTIEIDKLKAGEAVGEFLANFDDDDMENLFGDGFKVIITKDGIEVEEYSHD
jgi:hypothetical protein